MRFRRIRSESIVIAEESTTPRRENHATPELRPVPTSPGDVKLTPPAGVARLASTLVEFWNYRELFFFFVWRDLKVRYKQTALGAGWAIIQPLMTMVVFTLLFGRLAKLPNDGLPYPIFYYSALLPWTYFATSISMSGNSLLTNQNLVTKVYFPRMMIPASSVLTGLFDFAIASVLLVAMMVYYDLAFTWEMLLWPVLVLPLTILALGMGFLLSALNVNYRDVKHTIPFLVQMGMFLSPVVYPATMIPAKYKYLMMFHPVAGVIEGFRAMVSSNRPIDWLAIGGALATNLVVLTIGFLYFRKTERSFADFI